MLDEFLSSTVALETEAVRSLFRRHVDSERFLNDIGRTISAFLGKFSREMTLNCPSNTVILDSITFIIVRHGKLFAAYVSENILNLVPVFSPATTTHLQIPLDHHKGYIWCHGYDEIEDVLYLLNRQGTNYTLYMYSLKDETNPVCHSVRIEGFLCSLPRPYSPRERLSCVGGKVYIVLSRTSDHGTDIDRPYYLVYLPAIFESNVASVKSQVIMPFLDSSHDWPVSFVGCEGPTKNEHVISVTYCTPDEEWFITKVIVQYQIGRIKAKITSIRPLDVPDGYPMEYMMIKPNLILLCAVSGGTFYSLCDETGRELGNRRYTDKELEPMDAQIDDVGTVYIPTNFIQTIYNPVECIHAFYTQARHLTYHYPSNWFFDGKQPDLVARQRAASGTSTRSLFRRHVDSERFLNDVGRTISAFLGKLSREMTLNCPSNTVILDSITFIIVRHGKLFAAYVSENILNLVPVFSPATTAHLQIPLDHHKGYIWCHGYDEVEDVLYLLNRQGTNYTLYMYSLKDETNPVCHSVRIEGFLCSLPRPYSPRERLSCVGGKVYLPVSLYVIHTNDDNNDEDEDAREIFCIVYIAADFNSKVAKSQDIIRFSESSRNWPPSLIGWVAGGGDDTKNEHLLSMTYCTLDEEWFINTVRVQHDHNGRQVKTESLCRLPLTVPNGYPIEYLMIKPNMMRLCGSLNDEHGYFYSLCNERGNELGNRRRQVLYNEIEPLDSLIDIGGTVYISSRFNQTSDNPIDCIHAFYTQARHLTSQCTPNWFFDSDEKRIRIIQQQ